MKGIVALIGLLSAMALLTAGLLLLPQPGADSTAGIFTALWLLFTVAAAAAFGRESLRRDRLGRIRKSFRRTGRSNTISAPAGRFAPGIRGELIRQRGRRTD